jgi:replicative DNA helicase
MENVPRNQEAEQSIISGLLTGHRTDLGPGDFYYPEHRLIYKVIQHLWNKGIEPDAVLISDQLRRSKKLDQAGGASYMARLISDFPVISQDGVDRYTDVVRDLALLRHLAKMGKRMEQAALGMEQPAGELLAHLYAQIGKMGDTGDGGLTSYQTMIQETLIRVKDRRDHPKNITGVPTPFGALNRLTNGLQPSDLIIVAGRPSMGKSALAAQLADYAAFKHGPALVFSLEMSKDQWSERGISREAMVPNQLLRTGQITDKQYQRIAAASRKLCSLNVELDDTPGLTAQQILLAARKAKARLGGLSMVVIDYLQLMRSSSRNQSRDQELGETTRLFKLCAKELNTPVVLLSQLNRKCEEREDKRPILSDLRESGNIEQDADIIMFVYRDEFYNRQSEDAGLAEILIGKQRNGPTGQFKLAWMNEFTRFSDIAKGEDPDEQRAIDNAFDSSTQDQADGIQMSLTPNDEGTDQTGDS